MTLARALVLIVLAAGCAQRADETPAPEPPADIEAEVVPPAASTAPPAPEVAALSSVAERTVESVVNVWSERIVEAPPHPFTDPFFDRFTERDWGEVPRERRTRSLGSGVLVAKGVVVTNHHVIFRARSVRVAFSNGDDYEATVAGSDPLSDLAVLRFDDGDAAHPPLPLGESNDLRLGQAVLAVGNPYGVGHSVTLGIVSGVGRADLGIVDYEDFIQTDAAINPGNSGGALVNESGQLIGINTAILSRTGGYQGIGFAIPSTMARSIVNELIAHGKVSRGWLGVSVQDLTEELAKAMALPTSHGVVVTEVADASPAAKAGLERGDVIVSIGGELVSTGGRLRNIVAEAEPGSAVEAICVRGAGMKKVTVTLGAVATPKPEPWHAPQQAAPQTALGGLEVRELDAVTRADLGVTEPGGVLVVHVAPQSPADDSDMRPGDIIMQVRDASIKSREQLQRAYDASGPQVVVRIMRSGRSVFVVLHKSRD